MFIRNVSIRNYRGIRQLDWSPASRFSLLIGPGDSCKTSILDAIALAMSPRWGHSFADSDFFQCAVEEPIAIEVTVSHLDPDLLRESTFGLFMRGVDAAGMIHDDPADEHDVVLTIRLTIDETLEPAWTVIKDANDEGKPISAANRARAPALLLSDAEHHLRWTQGSALAYLTTGGDISGVRNVAHRAARSAVFDAPDEELSAAAESAAAHARQAGASKFSAPRAGLDPVTSRGAGLVLHDGAVPARQLGKGSQRLTGLALQMALADNSSCVLADEIESGLEPHRLTAVLARLRSHSTSHGQAILTTHSPVAVTNVEITDVCVVRRADDGHVTVREVPSEVDDADDLPQRTARSIPSALLARRIVLCEGKTEVGLLSALAEVWDFSSDHPLSVNGSVFAVGGGPDTPRKAELLANLGYAVALLADDDLTGGDYRAFHDGVAAASKAGVGVHLWPAGDAVEHQLFSALPLAQALVNLYVDQSGDPEAAAISMRTGLAAKLQVDTNLISGTTIEEWSAGLDRPAAELLRPLADMACKKKWFKNETWGRLVGTALVESATSLDADGPLVTTLNVIRDFCYQPADLDADS